MSGRDTADQPCENRLSCGPRLLLAPPMCRYLAAFTCEIDPWLRVAQLASGRRGVGGERHTALPHDASFDSQAPAPTFGTNSETEGTGNTAEFALVPRCKPVAICLTLDT